MNGTLAWGTLLAQETRLRSFGRNFRGAKAQLDRGDLVTMALIIVGVIIAVVVLERISRRQDRKRFYRSPRALFRVLCLAHDVPWNQRGLLKRLAKSRGLAQPAELFVAPRQFDEPLPPGLLKYAGLLRQLQRRIFAEVPTQPSPPADTSKPAS